MVPSWCKFAPSSTPSWEKVGPSVQVAGLAVAHGAVPVGQRQIGGSVRNVTLGAGYQSGQRHFPFALGRTFCSRGVARPSPALGAPGKASLCSYQRQFQPAGPAPRGETRRHSQTSHTTTEPSGNFCPRDPPGLGMSPRYPSLGQPGLACLGCKGSAAALPNSLFSKAHES